MKLSLFSLLLFPLLFLGCGSSNSTGNQTYTDASYVFVNARLTSNSASFISKFEADGNIFKTVTTKYISSSDANITWEDNASKRLYLSQDFEEINASIESLLTDRKLISLSIGNKNSSTLPLLEIKGPVKDDLVNNKAIIKVIHGANLEEYTKVTVKVEPSQLDTGPMEYRDSTPSWREILTGDNKLFNILDDRGIIINGGQETFNLYAKRAYILVIYESAEVEDTPFLMMVDVTPN